MCFKLHLILFFLLLLSCSGQTGDGSKFSKTTTSSAETDTLSPASTSLSEVDTMGSAQLLEKIEVYPDLHCNKTLEDVIADWDEYCFPYTGNFTFENDSTPSSCYWTRVSLQNPFPVPVTRVLYFHGRWQTLECYLPLTDTTYRKKRIGIDRKQEVVYVRVPPLEKLVFYAHYPDRSNALNHLVGIWEMSEEDFFSYQSRDQLKFLLLGALLFPILFFVSQLIVQKDKLGFYYLIFLLGSAAQLLTLVDILPFFDLSPKIIASRAILMRLFLLSAFLTLAGLAKYIQCFLNIHAWSHPLHKFGHLVLAVWGVIIVIPFIYPAVFQKGNYGHYLFYFQIWGFLTFTYILALSIWAVLKKIPYSRVLLLAFSPLIVGGVLYAGSYSFLQGFSWANAISLILITSFIFTLFLFGVVLGVRNNAVKAEKLRLEEKAESLKELDAFKTRFYTNITHEFRTPLTVILGMANQIKEDPGRWFSEGLRMISRNGQNLLRLVNQMLDLRKLESGSLSVQLVQGDIIAYLKYLVESFHSYAETKDIALHFQCDENSLLMDYDPEKLQIIISNLLSNAIKFTPAEGDVYIEVNGKQTFEVCIKDTGIGIAPDQLPHIFDRFYQVEDKTVPHTGGTGIGLALTQELIKLLHGTIEVKSPAPGGKGTQFKISLPITQNAPLTEAIPKSDVEYQAGAFIHAESAASFTAGTATQGAPEILIIEDNKDVISYLKACLGEQYQIEVALDGKQGLDLALEKLPDLILSDVMMPKMDGFAVCQALKNDQRTSHIPIILLTAKADIQSKLEGLERGADAYLPKPFNREELLLRIRKLIEMREKLQARFRSLESPTPTEDKSIQIEERFLQKLREILEENLDDEDFGIVQLCRAIGVSRMQLHRKLKALTGKSTSYYIRSIRLHKARELLRTTDLNVSEVAYEVGFRNAAYFSTTFLEEFGMSPNEVRERSQ